MVFFGPDFGGGIGETVRTGIFNPWIFDKGADLWRLRLFLFSLSGENVLEGSCGSDWSREVLYARGNVGRRRGDAGGSAVGEFRRSNFFEVVALHGPDSIPCHGPDSVPSLISPSSGPGPMLDNLRGIVNRDGPDDGGPSK